MQIRDLFTIEDLATVVPSPDGSWYAVVIRRAWTETESYRRDYLGGNDHADVWLLPAGEGDAVNLTEGAADGRGAWGVVWSPGGGKLSLLRTGPDGEVQLYTATAQGGPLQRISDRSVDLSAASGRGWAGNPVVWLSDSRLIVPVLPAGERPWHSDIELMSQRIASRVWPDAAAGRRSTAHVIHSGAGAPLPPPGQLMIVDLDAGTQRVLAEGRFRSLTPSPDRRHLALIEVLEELTPSPDVPVRTNLLNARFGIIDVMGASSPRWHDALKQPQLREDAWAPDSRTVAVWVEAQDTRSATPHLVPAGAASMISTAVGSVTAEAHVWTESGRLLVRGRSADVGGVERAGWWEVDVRTGRALRNVTSGLATVPPQLVRLAGADEMALVQAGALRALDVRSGSLRDLIASTDVRVLSVAWRPEAPARNLVLNVESDGARSFVLAADLDRVAQRRPLAKAPPGSTATFGAGGSTVAFTARTPDGTFLWTARGDEQPRRRLALNQHLADIDQGERRLLSYRGLRGDSLHAVLLLPVGYEKGRRYPLITWVYPENVYTDTLSAELRKENRGPFNLQLLAARGFAVLLPSMPLGPYGAASDPLLSLTDGVLPAIDRAVELGFADPDRLGVMGQSYGGYGTLGLIGQTNRFHAAVAMAAPVNLYSLYGTFDARRRYTDWPLASMLGPGFSESGQFRMGAPPWKDPERYMRNSPISYVDRITTPVMLIQGDADFFPLQQGEEMFTALYRLGRRAQFVRYWGEGHGGAGASPANIEDMWTRVFDFFHEHLGIP